jgi:hypothetical protein
MAIDFPSNPANNETYSYNSKSWYWANNYGTWLANTTITGYTGSLGYTGSIGYSGSKGDTGFVGSTGYTGSKGDLGYTGSQAGLAASNYVVRAFKNGSQTINSNSDTVIAFSDDFDPNNWNDSNKFTPTIAGYYQVNLSVWWDAGSVTNNQTNIQIRKNGTTQMAIDQAQIVTGSGYGQSLSTIVYMNGSSDYLEFTAYTGNPTSQGINSATGGTFYTAELIAYGLGYAGSNGATGYTGSASSVGRQIAIAMLFGG